MRILLVTPFLPYPGVPHAGAKLVYHLLKTLSRDHSVVLLSRCYPEEEVHLPHLRGLAAGVETVHAAEPLRTGSVRSLARTVLTYFRLGRRAAEILRRERFDLCQMEYTETAFFLPGRVEVPTVLTCHDVIVKPAYRRFAGARGAAKMRAWLSWRASRLIEARCVARSRMIFALSDEDAAWAARLYPRVPCRAIHYPGGIDFAAVPPRREVPGRILFLGALSRPQNIEAVRYFVDNVWPAVRGSVPAAEFRIVGGGLPPDIRGALARDPRIRLTGRVERVEDEYAEAAVFAAPILQGGGIIVKVLDAMAAGVPVVTTTYGNEGIGARDGRDIVVSDSPGAFVEAIVRLLGDPAARQAVGESGRRLVEGKFSPEAFRAAVAAAYAELVPSGTGNRRPPEPTDASAGPAAPA